MVEDKDESNVLDILLWFSYAFLLNERRNVILKYEWSLV